jgi:drug/metabolite transporter (DMT)-like permease
MNSKNKRLLTGIALMLIAMMVVPVLDVMAKILSRSYPVMEVSWARFFFHTLWLLPILYWRNLKWWHLPKNPGLQVFRSLMLTCATVLFFTAIKSNPIPNALTLLFISPLVVAIIAPFLLGERFDLGMGVGVLVGFVGVIFVLQPNTEEFSPSLIFAFGAGICYAIYIVLTRKLSLSAPPLITLFYTAIVGTIVLTPVALTEWVMPDLISAILMISMGFVAAVAHFLIVKAFEFASASEISPFNYFEIIGAIIVSYVAFDFIPKPDAIIGMIVIIISGLFVSWRAIKINENSSDKVESNIERL